MNCRFCNADLAHAFLDLGFAPPSNAYLCAEELNQPEKYYPLRLRVCDNCFLVQTEDYAGAEELFSEDYAYFSSTSTSWMEHAAAYVNRISQRLKLGEGSLVIEVACNDGYLLKNFVDSGVPCLGIEPTTSTATAAQGKGIPVLREFFGSQLASELAEKGQQADLVIGNNVFAHVPDIVDFTQGLKSVLKPGGTITLEFPHLARLISLVQFDTVYHEHFSYLSLGTVAQIFSSAGLRVQDVECLDTHGGSLRVYGCHDEDDRATSGSVARVLAEEGELGLRELAIYQSFQPRADGVKNGLLEFLLEQKKLGKRVAGYGAAAKGNTLLNYAGVKPDLLSYVCDAAPAKQGKFLPGSHIPILPPSALHEMAPDYVLILPWNLSEEVMLQNASLAKQGTRFVVAVPDVKIL